MTARLTLIDAAKELDFYPPQPVPVPPLVEGYHICVFPQTATPVPPVDDGEPHALPIGNRVYGGDNA